MKIIRGKVELPVFALLHAPDGIGKTTFGSQAPEPVFLEAEKGSFNLDVARFEPPSDWPEAMKNLDQLAKEKHDFKSLVVDTLDWLESLLHKHIVDTCPKGQRSMEAAHGGYGKAYKIALEKWRNEFKPRIEFLREKKGMNIILLAHSNVTEFNNPQTETSYNRYQLKLYDGKNCSTCGFFREWVDLVLFANFETYSQGEGKDARGISTRQRKMWTSYDAAFDAKNRFNLPFEIGFSWEYLVKAIGNNKPEDCQPLIDQINRMKSSINNPDLVEKINKSIVDHKANPKMLKDIIGRIEHILDTVAQ